MPNQELKDLLEKLVQDKMSLQEIRRMEVLLHDAENAQTAQDLIASFFVQGDSENIPKADRKVLFEDMMRRALEKETSLKPVPAFTHRVHFLRRWGWAAASVIVLAAGAYLYFFDNRSDQTLASKDKQLQVDVAPGGNRAILTLADGRTIALDSASNGELAEQGNSQIVKLANGEIAYHIKGAPEKEVMWNTMSTPAGGQYHITLPDGTKAWLNAASSITFPAAFIDKDRRVKVTGEVYLEVAKNKKKPFKVDVDGKSLIEVLGTSFNVNAYLNEENIKTTLLQGRIKVSNGSSQAVLNPGQQAQVSNATAVAESSDRQATAVKVIDNVDLSQALAWKNGLFSFNNADLKSVLRQLERWYDIKVRYVGAGADIPIKGKMYRNVSLSTVLEFLKESGLKFRMEGKNLIVL